MIKENVNIYDDLNKLSEGFTQFIIKALEVYPHINLSLSGGSTPKVLFDYWAKNCKETIAWERISFFWGDERCVAPDDDMSNYGMTKKHLFDSISAIQPQQIFRCEGENDPQQEAMRYSDVLKNNVSQRNDIPSFEIVMLGLGDDGHTVSIFPNHIELWDADKDCIVAAHPESGMERVSISGRVVNNAQHAVFLATGKNKAEKVKQILQNRENLYNTYPAARVNPTQGYLHWFLDKEAASLL